MEGKKQIHNFHVIYFVAFVGDLTLSMLIVLSVLHATIIGLSTIEVGLIGGAYGFAYMIMPAILGRISDLISRKISLLIATLGQSFLTFLFLYFITKTDDLIFFGLFLSLFLYGIVYGFFWPVIEAYISENTEHSAKEHEKGMSNFCITWSFGFALGPFIAGFLYDFNILLACLLMFTVYCSSFLLLFFKLPLIKPNNNKASKNKAIKSENFNKPENSTKPYSHSNKILIMLLMGVMIYAVISKALISYFTNYAALPEGLNWSGTLIGQVIFFFGVGRTLYFIIARYFKNSLNAITQSFLIIGLCTVAFSFIYTPILIMITFFILGFFIGRSYIVSLELLLKYEQDKKGAKAGIFESTVGIGSSFAPLIAGLIAIIHLKLPFFFFGLFAFIFVIIHLFLKRKTPFEKVENNS
ncbi:MAG: MFS transporter [Candidatus Hermodarchaeota archaeon]